MTTSVAEKYTDPDVVAYWRDFNARGLQAAEAYLLQKYIPTSTILLDLGCGAGRVAHAVGDEYRVFGMDLTYALMAAGKTDTTHFWQGNILSLALPSHTFPTVLCLYATLQHIPTRAQRRQGLAEMARVLQTGGHLLIGIDNLAPATQLYGWWLQRKLRNQPRQPLTTSAPKSNGQGRGGAPPTIRDHLRGVYNSLRWRSWEAVRDLVRGDERVGDTHIDRVSDRPTRGTIPFHIYRHTHLVEDCTVAGLQLVDYISEREARENQVFPEPMRQLEHQIVYLFQRK